MNLTASKLSAAEEIEAALAQMGSEAECETCGTDIAPGAVVTLQHSTLCPDCAFTQAAHTLAPLLFDAWTPADIEASRREYEEAQYVMAILFLRIGNRLRRAS